MGIDFATILLAWLVQALMLTLLLLLHGKTLASASGAGAGLLFGLAAVKLLQASLYLLIAVVILHVLFSWFNPQTPIGDRKSTRLNSSHSQISYAVFCLKEKNSRLLVRPP